MPFVALLITAAVAFLASLSMSVFMMFFEGKQCAGLGDLHIYILLLLLTREGFCYFRHLWPLQRVREHELEDDKKVSEAIGRFMVRHTVTFNCLDIIWLDDLTRLILYSDFSPI